MDVQLPRGERATTTVVLRLRFCSSDCITMLVRPNFRDGAAESPSAPTTTGCRRFCGYSLRLLRLRRFCDYGDCFPTTPCDCDCAYCDCAYCDCAYCDCAYRDCAYCDCDTHYCTYYCASCDCTYCDCTYCDCTYCDCTYSDSPRLLQLRAAAVLRFCHCYPYECGCTRRLNKSDDWLQSRWRRTYSEKRVRTLVGEHTHSAGSLAKG